MSRARSLVVGIALGLAAGSPSSAAAAPSSSSSSSSSPLSPEADDVGASARYVDEGALLEAAAALLAQAHEPVRVALLIDDADVVRQRSLERALVRVLRDRRREDIVTPSLVRARVAAAASAADAAEAGQQVGVGLAADHVVLGVVVDGAGGSALQLRLFSTEKGAVVATGQVPLQAAAKAATTTRTLAVGAAADEIADAMAEAVEARGVDVRAHRIGVPPIVCSGAAKEARLDRFLQGELSRALRARGFLVVERAALSAAMEQMALQELAGTEKVAELGALLGAQSLLLAQVTDAADRFVVTARVVGVQDARVLGAVSAAVPREGVVAMAAVETRTPAEAALRSAIAPGWGQAYNGEGVKAVLFGVTTYGALLGTLGLGAGAVASASAYQAVTVSAGTTPAQAAQQATALREQANALFTTTAVAGGVTAAVWSFGIADALLSAPRGE